MTPLHRFSPGVTKLTREELRANPAVAMQPQPDDVEPVKRDGNPIDATSLIALLNTAVAEEADAVASDARVAPWVHACMRLTRAEAGDPSVWEWLATLPCRDYVLWRWTSKDGVVNPDRWRGPIHKQAIARLWWGAELLRNGEDYTPVKAFFSLQDYPNSYLHRPFVRFRPVALGLLAAMEGAKAKRGKLKSREVNQVASVVNLCSAGMSLATMAAAYQPDPSAYRDWLEGTNPADPDLASLPLGPADGAVPGATQTTATALAERMCEHAGLRS